MWAWMGTGGEVEVGVVLVAVFPGRIASSAFLSSLRLLILLFLSSSSSAFLAFITTSSAHLPLRNGCRSGEMARLGFGL